MKRDDDEYIANGAGTYCQTKVTLP